MRRLLILSAAALAACSGDSTPPSVATSVVVTPGSLTLDAIGDRRVVRAAVADQRGNAMPGAALTWTSGTPSATVVGLGGDSAAVTAVANGPISAVAQAGSASGSATGQVAQAVASVVLDAGNNQTANPGATLATQPRVQVRDRLGAGIPGVTVTFTVTGGGGTVAFPSVVTAADGSASTVWTLGAAAGTNSLSASVAGQATPVLFTAMGVTGIAATAATTTNQAAMGGTNVPVAPSVVVRSSAGAALAGVQVTFAVTSGGGSVSPATVTTNASGVATLSRWTLGAGAGLNTLSATVAGTTSPPLVFRAAGCEGAGPGYEITVCITSTMTASQRQAFQGAAARWSTVVTGDVPNDSGEVPEDACGAGTPYTNMTYDDLLIFASVKEIDGVGQILGQAGPCFVRTDSKLPVIGMMEFDAADLGSLEQNGTLTAVILHEMGHVIGIGTIWSSLGLLQNPSTSASVLDTYFSGTQAAAGFDAIGGTTYTGAKVPVENTGGPGTRNGHWRESVLKNELMTGYLNSGANPLSVLTVRSLADLGYTVDPSRADAFFLTLSVRSAPEAPAVSLHDDLYTGPVYTFSPRGAPNRIR